MLLVRSLEQIVILNVLGGRGWCLALDTTPVPPVYGLV